MRVLQVMTAVMLAGAAAPVAAATEYSGLVVFGDSLVDSGNAKLGAPAAGIPDPAPAASGYFDGRFSNGYNFADDVSFAINRTAATPFLLGGDNAAVGGAEAAFKSVTEVPPSFLTQLGLFRAAGRTIAADELVLVTFGGNDIRGQNRNTGAVSFARTVSDLSTGLGLLLANGARNILVTGLPDIGALPDTRKDALDERNPLIVPIATSRSVALNTAFAGVTSQAAALSGANVQFFDLLRFERSVVADPAAFGLPSTLRRDLSCLDAGAVALGCEGFLYFDDVHPTAQVHSAIAGGILGQLQIGAVPEPGTWATLLAGLGLMAALLRRQRRPVPLAIG